MHNKKVKIAFIHRYGLEGWICCGGHAIPGLIQELSEKTEIHFYGPKTTEEKQIALRAQLQMHELPYRFNRANPKDKFTKTILWYCWLPIIGIRCRLNGTRLIWNDETVPLTAPILRLFYGKKVAITVMDFFMRIYTQNHPRLHWLRDMVEKIDLSCWKKLPLIFTKVLYTQEFLAERGVPEKVMHLYRNPVDHTKFHPVDESVRQATREKFGFTDSDIVLSHHGILHPNKGNDWIFQCLEKLKEELPCLKYLLIGNGPEMESLQHLAKKLDLEDRVVFAGWLPSEEDLNNALASADIGLVMRIGQETDHFHMTDTLAHEMACGKPILAVNLKGIAEVIRDGENGYTFLPDESALFCTRLMELALSPSLRTVFSKASLTYSEDLCSIEKCTQHLLILLLNLIKNEPTIMNRRRSAYLQFRWWLGKRELTLFFVLLRKDLARLLVSKKSDVVIEGYPRSGNSFTETAFRFSQAGMQVEIASHLHLPAHVTRAVRLKKPCLVLIRNPVDAIASLLAYYGGNYPIQQAIREYIDFYELVYQKHDQVLVASFDQVRKNFGKVMAQFNERFDCSFKVFKHTPENQTACFKIIKKQADKKYGKSASGNRTAKPTPGRQKLKQKMLHALSSDLYKDDLTHAESIYQALTQPE